MYGHRVRETTSTQGIGPIELNGAVGTGFRRFRDEFADGQQCAYVISNVGPDGNGDYEIGIGTLTYGTTDTLSRDIVERSSNGGAKVNWGAGVKTVFSDLLPARLVADSRVPAGMLAPFAGAVAPTGWLLCHGQAVSRSTYADLFAAIGTAYGAGDGSTTFNLPDLRGRVAAGKDDMGGVAAGRLTSAVSGVDGATLGAAGGDERQQSHAHAQGGTFDTTPVGDHRHTAYHGNTTAGVPDLQGFNTSSLSLLLNERFTNTTDVMTPAGAHSHSVTISGNTTSAGSGNSQNVQPTIVLQYIIKT